MGFLESLRRYVSRETLRSIVQKIRARFPSKLPMGSSDFDQFAESILKIYSIPDLPSYRHAIATMIMHLNPQVSHMPKAYFARSIRKAMANEIAWHKIQQYKEQMKEVTSPIEEKPTGAIE